MCTLSVDFIYSEYASTLGHVGNDYRKMVWQIAEDYACASVLLRLPGYSPMPAFGEVIDVPLVVRHAQKSKAQVSQAQAQLTTLTIAMHKAQHTLQPCTFLLCYYPDLPRTPPVAANSGLFSLPLHSSIATLA